MKDKVILYLVVNPETWTLAWLNTVTLALTILINFSAVGSKREYIVINNVNKNVNSVE